MRNSWFHNLIQAVSDPKHQCCYPKITDIRHQIHFTDSPFYYELDAVALLQYLHQCLGVIFRGLLQGDSLRQTVGHNTAGVLLDPLIRHRDQAALSHSLTCIFHDTV